MANERTDIAQITRTYGGLEGPRIKAGTRFAIGKNIEGLRTVSEARFRQLKGTGLARYYDPNAPAAPAARPNYAAPTLTAAPKEVGTNPGKKKAGMAAARQASRRKTQEEEPADPQPISTQSLRGSQTGREAPSPSSQVARQSSTATSRQRGNRRQK